MHTPHTFEEVQIDKLAQYEKNSRTHSEDQVQQIINSIKQFGFTNPILIDEKDVIIAGHGRYQAARALSIPVVPCIRLKGLSEGQKRAYVIADNKLALNAGWDEETLKSELKAIQADGLEEFTGFNEDELNKLLAEITEEAEEGESMADKYMIPPFTILNAREGTWKERKRMWLDTGIKSELGRKLTDTCMNGAGNQDYSHKHGNDEGGSVFDPVLCEIMYKWFTKKDDTIVDCFAGGSVRGLIAAVLNRKYLGHELRGEQVKANREQMVSYPHDQAYTPVWHEGDSLNIQSSFKDVKADFIFTCPPYADLEVYSKLKEDISNMPYKDFIAVYREIIKRTCTLLNNDRFAAVVVGDVRDKEGNYYNFVGDTVEAFKAAGMSYYNECILVTPTGSLPLRAGRFFEQSRKIGKAHQNVLIFVKGDPKAAALRLGKVDGMDEEMAIADAEIVAEAEDDMA